MNPGSNWLVSADYLRKINGLFPFFILGGSDQAWGSAMIEPIDTDIPAFSVPTSGRLTRWLDNAIAVRGFGKPAALKTPPNTYGMAL